MNPFHRRRRVDVTAEGPGGLALRKLLGSTARNFTAQRTLLKRTRVVAGLSLPMPVIALRKPKAPLRRHAPRAVGGGRQGIREPDPSLVGA